MGGRGRGEVGGEGKGEGAMRATNSAGVARWPHRLMFDFHMCPDPRATTLSHVSRYLFLFGYSLGGGQGPGGGGGMGREGVNSDT